MAAMSSGTPRRVDRTDARIRFRYSSFRIFKAAPVSVTPGATMLLRTPCLPPTVAVSRLLPRGQEASPGGARSGPRVVGVLSHAPLEVAGGGPPVPGGLRLVATGLVHVAC